MQFHLTGLEFLIQWAYLCPLGKPSSQLCEMWSGTQHSFCLFCFFFPPRFQKILFFSPQIESFISKCAAIVNGHLAHFVIFLHYKTDNSPRGVPQPAGGLLHLLTELLLLPKNCFVRLPITRKSGRAIKRRNESYTQQSSCIVYCPSF